MTMSHMPWLTRAAPASEPPVYVSDRRFTKCVTLLQVAAYANGAREVNEYDCLLLQFVLGQRAEDGDKVLDYVLDNISADPGILQNELTLLGLFGRACRVLRSDHHHGGSQELVAECRAILRNENPWVRDCITAGEVFASEDVTPVRFVINPDERPADRHERSYDQPVASLANSTSPTLFCK